MDKKPLFVTLDAEGDNGWERPRVITTENSQGVERFQSFCEKYDIKPIYLTTYEMAKDNTFVKTLKQKNKDGLCEIGMHMHGWSTPPEYELTGDDLQNLPFITEYPESIIRDKVKTITELLEKEFETEVISHRSGRWIITKEYLEILSEYGYKIDCSVTPLIDWSCSIGDPNQRGGENYKNRNPHPEKLTFNNGSILEIPMTTRSNPLYDNIVVNTGLRLFSKKSRIYNGVSARRIVMLRPIIRNTSFLLNMIDRLGQDCNVEHMEFIVHTSELFPNTCPHCKNEKDLDAIYDLMGKMFERLSIYCESMTFREYVNTLKL